MKHFFMFLIAILSVLTVYGQEFPTAPWTEEEMEEWYNSEPLVFLLDYESGEKIPTDIEYNWIMDPIDGISPDIEVNYDERGFDVKVTIKTSLLSRSYSTLGSYLWNIFGWKYNETIGKPSIPNIVICNTIPEGYDDLELSIYEIKTKDFDYKIGESWPNIDSKSNLKRTHYMGGIYCDLDPYEGYFPKDICFAYKIDHIHNSVIYGDLVIYGGQYSYEEENMRALTELHCRVDYKKTTDVAITMADDSIDDNAVYNLSGVKVGDSIEGLLPGIYVRAGKKIVVR